MLNDIYIPPKEIELIKDEARELLQAIKDYENSLESLIEMQKKIEQIKTRIKKSYSDKLDGNLPYDMMRMIGISSWQIGLPNSIN